MSATMWELIVMRIKSFAYSAGTAIAVVVLGYIASPDFASLVTQHFGGIAGAIAGLLIPEIVKHIRNVMVLNAEANALGSDTLDDARRHVILI